MIDNVGMHPGASATAANGASVVSADENIESVWSHADAPGCIPTNDNHKK